MENKYFLYFVSFIAIGISLVFTSFKFENSKIASYIPRSDYHSSSDWAGAAAYYRMIRSNLYTGQIEKDDILKMNKALEKSRNQKSLGLEWSTMGPTNVGGRTRAILIYNENPNIVFASGVSGGLFKSENSGTSWQKVSSFNEHMPIGSIARLGNGTIYVGTGSSHDFISGEGGSGFIGGGLFKSSDDGNTWVKVFSNDDPFDGGSLNDWKYIDALVADPLNTNKLWIGKTDGLFSYIDDNANLEPMPFGLPAGSDCEDVEVSGDVIIASMRSSISSKVYVSTDGGVSFTLSGVPSASGGRISVAVSKDDNNYMYAALANAIGELQGIYATVDKGSNWYAIAGEATPLFNPYGTQGTYNNCITTLPGSPGKILLGGLTIYSWELVGEIPSISYFDPKTVYFGNSLNPYYVHPDIHEFQWDANGVLYVGCDGGIYKSNDFGLTYYGANVGYITTQFYGIGISNDGKVVGGTQDNGTQYLNFESLNDGDAVQVGGGDGFDAEISYINNNFIFSTLYYNALFRSTDNGNSSSPFASLEIPSGLDGNPNGDFYTDIRLYENKNNAFSQTKQNFTIFPEFPGFVFYDTIVNGNTAIGYVPAGTSIAFESATGLQLTEITTSPLFYYSDYNFVDSSNATIIDTITVVTNLDTIFSIDTTIVDFVIVGDIVPEEEADSCFIFLGNSFCYDLDTIFSVDTVIVDIIQNTETSFVFDYPIIIINNVSDTLKARDYATSILALSYSTSSAGEIWVTREPLKTNGNPVWVKAATGISNSFNLVTSMEWSPDGNSLYIGLASGEVKRIGNWNNAWTAEQMTKGNSQYVLETYTIKTSTGGAVLGIGVDYSLGIGEGASEKVVIAQGSYGGSDKVRVSNTAASATSASEADFQGIWNVEAPFDGMPVYSAVMDRLDPNKIIVGTDYGVWATDDGGTSWSESNGGDMGRVPVFEIRQQWRPSNEVFNSGIIYAGTHGQGIKKNEDFFMPTSIIESKIDSELSSLIVYPNPVISSGIASVQFTLENNSSVILRFYSMDGKLQNTISKPSLNKGKNTINFSTNEFSTGSYIVQVSADGGSKTCKFVNFK